MGASLQVRAERTIKNGCPIVQPTDQMVSDVLSDVARTIWASKTAENLAACIGCSVRGAARYLSGEREWSGDALAAIVAEILRRHAMRNVKGVARQ